MSEHTPGRWRVVGERRPEDPPEEPVFVDGPGDKNCVNTMRYSVATCRGPDADANARLIAAAPELLKAAESAEAWFSTPTEDYPPEEASSDIVRDLRAAISKAKGESDG